MPEINLEYPIWFIVFCLLGGVLYTWLLYSKRAPWGNSINKGLSVLRFLIVSILMFLILNPLLRQLINSIEKPAFVIAVDNSTSVVNDLDSIQTDQLLNQLSDVSAHLIEKGFEVELKTLNADVTEPAQIDFDQKTTDINKLLRKVESVYEGRNLSGALLVSDGNYNQGVSPAFFPYTFPVYSLGVGDTTRKEDLILKSVLYNKIAYQGNKFPIRIDVMNKGMVGENASVVVKHKGKVVRSEIIQFKFDNSLTSVDFSIEANQKGVQRYSVEIITQRRESIKLNNQKQIFVDIIEGKQKILLIAPGAHPDIKAIRSVVNSNENYEFSLFIPGMNKFKEDKYDLVIVHQANDRRNKMKKYVDGLQEKGVPMLFVLGRETNIVTLSRIDDRFNFKMIRTQTDLVRPAFNDNFTKFKYDLDHNAILSEYPPIKVPYGDFVLTPNTEVLLYQKVGSITTQKPLIYVIEDSNGKFGYMLGDGFWQWRLQEYALTEDTKAFDDLFLKLIQYLSTKEDKRKFKLYTHRTDYFDNEPVEFQAELYNDIYEKVYGNEIRLEIVDENNEKSEFTFTNSSTGGSFKLSGLEEGAYRYTGFTQRGKVSEVAGGRFTVQKQQLELLDQTADFSLLREISRNTEANFVKTGQSNELFQALDNMNAKGVVHSEEEFSSLINLKWLFFLLLGLISIEWFTRKYSGGY